MRRPAAPPDLRPGVSHALARWRAARYRDVAIAITADIDARASRLRGRAAVSLALARPAPIVLDWAPARRPALASLRVNGARCRGARFRGEHLVIPAMPAGRVEIAIELIAPIRAKGTPLTGWRDPSDGARYVHSLFVPAEARRVFPCFDQPDLKTRFTLDLTVPARWTVVSNEPARSVVPAPRGRRRFGFPPTPPISTYVFAFAAGPFVAIPDRSARVPSRLLVRRSIARKARRDAPAILVTARRGIRWIERYLDTPFPFAKHDLVAVPAFFYGGMEHAGATFLREESMLLGPHPVAAAAARRRHILLHEIAHQWMGDLVTMRWFDDLWLKEGFANFLAVRTLRDIGREREARAMLAELRRTALGSDELQRRGLHRRLANIADARALYGPTVYCKAPLVLAEAERLVGRTAFRCAVARILRDHRWSSFDRHDFVGALEAESGRSLSAWARTHIMRPGATGLLRLELRRSAAPSARGAPV